MKLGSGGMKDEKYLRSTALISATDDPGANGTSAKNFRCRKFNVALCSI